jgi:hypothetical protein
MSNEEQNNKEGCSQGCWARCCGGSCAGTILTFLLSIVLMGGNHRHLPFNEVEIVFLGFVLGGIVGFIEFVRANDRR